MASNDTVTLRPLEPTDRDRVLALLTTSLHQGDDPRIELLYAWKHEQNFFGPSLLLGAVARAGRAMVGAQHGGSGRGPTPARGGAPDSCAALVATGGARHAHRPISRVPLLALRDRIPRIPRARGDPGHRARCRHLPRT